MATSTETMMAWEGQMYVAAYGSTATSSTGMTLAENVDEIKVPVGNFGEVEHHLQKHGGQKAFLKGYQDYSFSFVISKEYEAGENNTRVLADDVAIIMAGIQSRKPVRILLADYEGGKGQSVIFCFSAARFPYRAKRLRKLV